MGDIKNINSSNFKSKQFDGEVSFKNAKDNYSIVWILSKGIVTKKLKRTELDTKPLINRHTKVVQRYVHLGRFVLAQKEKPFVLLP